MTDEEDELLAKERTLEQMERAAQGLADPRVARALRTYALLVRGQYQEALSNYDELLAELAEGSGASAEAADLLLCKAIALDGLGRQGEAQAVRLELVQRFRGGTDPSTQGFVVMALYEIAVWRLRDDKAIAVIEGCRAGRQSFAALRCWLDAEAAEHEDDDCLLLVRGYACHLAGDEDAARELVAAALRRNETGARQVALALAAMNRLPEDEAFLQLTG
jgi:tetratricopeptide (TPR) repeat protein